MGYKFPFVAIESKFQCAREYLGYMFTFFSLQWVQDKSTILQEVTWINDNSAAISWAQANKCNIMSAQYAFMVVTWQQLSSNISFNVIEHQVS